MDIIFGFFVFAVVFFIAAGILTVIAKRQADFRVVGGSAQELLVLLEQSGALNSGWKRTQGRGGVNIKLGFLRGGRDDRPVLSIDINDVSEGAHVTAWMSEWKTVAIGIMEPMPAIAVILRRNRIVKLLDQITEPIPPSGPLPAAFTPQYPAGIGPAAGGVPNYPEPASSPNPAGPVYPGPDNGSQQRWNYPPQQGYPSRP